jgi:hypothetical protein
MLATISISWERMIKKTRIHFVDNFLIIGAKKGMANANSRYIKI